MRAQFVQTLVYYDGPILALLKNRKGTNVLAYAIHDQFGDIAEPYLAKPVSEKVLSAYMEQKVDLHFALSQARGGDPFIFDWDLLDDEVMMTPAEGIVEDWQKYLPPVGFFARNHTERYLDIDVSILVSRSYRIDGRWSAKDFSRFYSKLDDLYSLFSFLHEMRQAGGPLTKKLVDTIANYPWQRGGSYLAFFRDIAAEAKEEYPLQVSKIKYASPGEIEVRGVAESLSQIDQLVRTFGQVSDRIRKTHKELRSILERDGVLGSDDLDLSSPALTNLALDRADALLERLLVPDPRSIYEACGSHVVTYSKIALAVFRRGEELHRFYAEGRMRLPA